MRNYSKTDSPLAKLLAMNGKVVQPYKALFP
jgi:hypothetical protein